MNSREKLLVSIFLSLFIGSITLFNIIDAFTICSQTEAKGTQYEEKKHISQKLTTKIAEKRSQLEIFKTLNKQDTIYNPYELGKNVKTIIEKAGGSIKFFSIIGKADNTVLETTFQADREFLPVFFSLIDKTNPPLTILSMNCNSNITGLLDITMKVQYEK